MFHGDLKGYTFEDGCSKVDSVYTILCEFEKIFFSHKLKEKTGEKKRPDAGLFSLLGYLPLFFPLLEK